MPDPQDDRPIADASSFLDDHRPEGDDPGPSTVPDPETGGYDLAERDPISDPGPGLGAGTPAPSPGKSPRPVPRPRPADRPKAELTPAPVNQPWSRMAEWGPALSRIGLALLATAVLAYLGASIGGWLLSAAIVAVGLGTAVLLSYPIAITLERPVRMTPEHAIRDYYMALAHHAPHYRRMWLLLSSAGRAEPEFSSYSAFRSYWGRLLAELKADRGGVMNPLSVRIEDYKSEKSAGLDAIEASYSIALYHRGRESDGPLHSARAETTLSRGPDRMWYLDDGRLPGR